MKEIIQRLWCSSVEVEGIAASMMMRKADKRYISRCLPLLQAKIDEIKALAANIEEPVEYFDIKPVNDVKTPEVQEPREEKEEQDEQEKPEETSTAPETLATETDSDLLIGENTFAEEIEEEAEPVTLEQAEDSEIAEEEADADEINEVETADEATVPENEVSNSECTEVSKESEPEIKDEIAQSAIFEETEDADISKNSEDSEPKLNVETIQSPEPQPQNATISLDEKLSRKISKNFRQAISLNDKFRFRRELFGNSNQQYDAALDLIAEMSTFDEARDYFLESYGWDAENPDVKSFLAILSNHFSN